MKRILLFALLTGVFAANTGCGLFHTCCYQPCGNRGCGSLYYNAGDGCGEPACATPRCASCASHRAVVSGGDCEPCGSPCGDCNSCGSPCGVGCSSRPWHDGPLSCAFAYLGRIFWYCPSCGERYWGDYYDNPPDCWDPCDNCGNYTGGGCPTCGSRGRVQRTSNGDYGDYAEEGGEEVATPQGTVVTQPGRPVSPTPAPTSTLKPAIEPRRTVKPSTSDNNGNY